MVEPELVVLMLAAQMYPDLMRSSVEEHSRLTLDHHFKSKMPGLGHEDILHSWTIYTWPAVCVNCKRRCSRH